MQKGVILTVQDKKDFWVDFSFHTLIILLYLVELWSNLNQEITVLSSVPW